MKYIVMCNVRTITDNPFGMDTFTVEYSGIEWDDRKDAEAELEKAKNDLEVFDCSIIALTDDWNVIDMEEVRR